MRVSPKERRIQPLFELAFCFRRAAKSKITNCVNSVFEGDAVLQTNLEPKPEMEDERRTHILYIET